MWEQVQTELPEAVRWQTTAVYSPVGFSDVCRVGIMRASLFSPPVLWFRHSRNSRLLLRHTRLLMDALQEQLGEPVVYAETADAVAEKFARFAGFTFVQLAGDRKQFERKI